MYSHNGIKIYTTYDCLEFWFTGYCEFNISARIVFLVKANKEIYKFSFVDMSASGYTQTINAPRLYGTGRGTALLIEWRNMEKDRNESQR